MADCWKQKMTRREADAARRRTEQAAYVYRCPYCDTYHLTTQPQGLAVQKRSQQYRKLRQR